MSSFTDKLVLSPSGSSGGFLGLCKKQHWTLESPFSYHIGTKDSGKEIIIDAGFTTDLASIPRILWPIYPPYTETYGKAAVLHDGMYAAELFNFIYADKKRNRKKCDDVFAEAMAVLDAPRFEKVVIHRAVRLFGGLVWRHHTKESIQKARDFVHYFEDGRRIV